MDINSYVIKMVIVIIFLLVFSKKEITKTNLFILIGSLLTIFMVIDNLLPVGSFNSITNSCINKCNTQSNKEMFRQKQNLTTVNKISQHFTKGVEDNIQTDLSDLKQDDIDSDHGPNQQSLTSDVTEQEQDEVESEYHQYKSHATSDVTEQEQDEVDSEHHQYKSHTTSHVTEQEQDDVESEHHQYKSHTTSDVTEQEQDDVDSEHGNSVVAEQDDIESVYDINQTSPNKSGSSIVNNNQEVSKQSHPTVDINSGTAHSRAAAKATAASNRDIAQRISDASSTSKTGVTVPVTGNGTGASSAAGRSGGSGRSGTGSNQSSDATSAVTTGDDPAVVGATGITESTSRFGSNIPSFSTKEGFSQSLNIDENVQKCEQIYKSTMSRDDKIKQLKENNCEKILLNEQARLKSMSGYVDKSDKILDWFLNNSSNIDQQRKKEYDDIVTDGWKSGWHFSDPTNWFKSDKRYKCYTNTTCKACPLKAETWPVDVMEKDAYQVLPIDDFSQRYNNLTQ